MAVRYLPIIELDVHGEHYRALSMSGALAENVVAMTSGAGSADNADEAELARIGLHVAAFVAGKCLLAEGNELAFPYMNGDTAETWIARVKEQCAQNILTAVFEACMDDAGLGDEEKPAGN